MGQSKRFQQISRGGGDSFEFLLRRGSVGSDGGLRPEVPIPISDGLDNHVSERIRIFFSVPVVGGTDADHWTSWGWIDGDPHIQLGVAPGGQASDEIEVDYIFAFAGDNVVPPVIIYDPFAGNDPLAHPEDPDILVAAFILLVVEDVLEADP